MDVSTASANSAPWPPATGPNSLPSQDVPHSRPPQHHHQLHPRLIGPAPHRVPIRPFFVREIYKNGFLKRLAHNEKKSSALSKLMRSDRYWVVFSVHDLGPEQVNFLLNISIPTIFSRKFSMANTVGVRIINYFGIQMVQNCSIYEWFIIQVMA